MFGAVPFCEMGTPPGTCILWFLGTTGLFKIKRDFMRQVESWMDWLQRFHPHGFNLVSADNQVSLKWAQAVGFQLMETTPRGARGTPFTLIIRKAR